MRQSGFDNVNITATTNVKLRLSKMPSISFLQVVLLVRQGMTREDLLKGNCEIAEQLGKDIKAYCPDVKHVVIIFNPADLTGLVTLLYSGLKPSQVTTLAAFGFYSFAERVGQEVRCVAKQGDRLCYIRRSRRADGCVRFSAVKVDGKPLNDLIGTDAFTAEEWETDESRT